MALKMNHIHAAWQGLHFNDYGLGDLPERLYISGGYWEKDGEPTGHIRFEEATFDLVKKCDLAPDNATLVDNGDSYHLEHSQASGLAVLVPA